MNRRKSKATFTEEEFNKIARRICRDAKKPKYLYFPSEEAKQAYLRKVAEIDKKYGNK